VTHKYRHWKSTLYEDAPMPYFMRLSCRDFGLHAGVLPGYPASHGCIRLPEAKAAAFFAKVDVGTLVEIVD
jgi:lipoprotein-anchoring transpeptidase ErfK/SrfK